VQMDPLSPVMNHYLGNMYVFSERYDEAIHQCDKVLEMHPQMRICIEMKGWATGMKGNWQEALKLFQEVHRLTNHPLKGLSGLGHTYAKLGQRDKAMECIEKIHQRQIEEPEAVIDGDLVAIYYALGDMDEAFNHIERYIEKRIVPPTFFLQYPPFKELRKDPRYEELKKRSGL
jgi:adenylate cyclase